MDTEEEILGLKIQMLKQKAALSDAIFNIMLANEIALQFAISLAKDDTDKASKLVDEMQSFHDAAVKALKGIDDE